MGAGWYFGSGQKVWGRQVNPEGDTEGIPSVYQAKITNSGGNLWILGLKSEGFGTLVASNSGASTEILGAWAWSVHKIDEDHKQTTLNNNLFDVKDSDFSASYMTYASSGNFDFPNQVGQTEGTQTGTLLAATTGTPAMYLRHPVGNASIAPLVVAAPTLALDIPGVDIGSTGGSGSLVGGLYTLTGAGTDLFNSADGCRFTSQWVTGDCTITAKVESLQNTNANAKAAVMIRSSLAPGSVDALMSMTPGAADFITRATVNTNATLAGFKTGLSNPYWIRLKRVGNNFTAFRSPDGTTWTQMTALPQPVNVASTALVGLAVTSHVSNTLCTATFSNVTITTP